MKWLLIIVVLLAVSEAVQIEVCTQVAGTPQTNNPPGCIELLSDAFAAASSSDIVHLNALQHYVYASNFTGDQQFLVVDTDNIELQGFSPSTRSELIFENDQIQPIVFGFRITASNFRMEHVILKANVSGAGSMIDLTNLFTFFWFLPSNICNNTYCDVNETIALYNNGTVGARECINGFTLQNNEIYLANVFHLVWGQGPIDLCGTRVNLNLIHNDPGQYVTYLSDGAAWDCTDCSSPCILKKRDLFQLFVPTCEETDFRLNCWDVLPPFDANAIPVWSPYWNCRCNVLAPYWSEVEGNIVGFASVEQAMDFGIIDLYLGDDPVLKTTTTLIDRPVHLIGHLPDIVDALMQNLLFQMNTNPNSGGVVTQCNCTVSLQIDMGVQPAFIVLNELLFTDRVSVRMEPLSAYALYRTAIGLVKIEKNAVAALYPSYNDDDDDDDITMAYPDPLVYGDWDDNIIVANSVFYNDQVGPGVQNALNALLFLDCTQQVVVFRSFFRDIHIAVWISAPAVEIRENSFFQAPETVLLGPGTEIILDSGSFTSLIRYNAFNNASSTGILMDGPELADISCNVFTDSTRGIWFPCHNPVINVCAHCDEYVSAILTCLGNYFMTGTCTDLIYGETHHPDQQETPFYQALHACAVVNGLTDVLTESFILWLQHYLGELCLLVFTSNPADPLLSYLIDPSGNPLLNPEATLCTRIVQEDFCTTNDDDDDYDDDNCDRPIGNVIEGNTFAAPLASSVINSPGSIWYDLLSPVPIDNTFEDNIFVQTDYLVDLNGWYDSQPLTQPFGPLNLVTGDPFWEYFRVEFPAPPIAKCFSQPDFQATYWVMHNWHNVSFPLEKDCNVVCAVQFNITEAEYEAHEPISTECMGTGFDVLQKDTTWVGVTTTVSCTPDPLSWTTSACFGNPLDGDNRERYVRYVIGPGAPMNIVVFCGVDEISEDMIQQFPPETVFFNDLKWAVDAATPYSVISISSEFGQCNACHIHVTKPLTIQSVECDEPATLTTDGPCLYALRFLYGSGPSTVQCLHFDHYCATGLQMHCFRDRVRHLSSTIVINPVYIREENLIETGENATQPFCNYYNLQTDTEDLCCYLLDEQLFGVPTLEEMNGLDGNFTIINNCFSNVERGVYIGPAAGATLVQDNHFGTGTCAVPIDKKRKKRSAVPHDSMTQGVYLSPSWPNFDCNMFNDQPQFVLTKRDAFDVTNTDDCHALAEQLMFGSAATPSLGWKWHVLHNEFGRFCASGVTIAGAHVQGAEVTEIPQWIKISANNFNAQRLYGIAATRLTGHRFKSPLQISRNVFDNFDNNRLSRAVAISVYNVIVHNNYFGTQASSEVSGRGLSWIANVHNNNTIDVTDDTFFGTKNSITAAGSTMGDLAYLETNFISNTFKDTVLAHFHAGLNPLSRSSREFRDTYGSPFNMAKINVAFNAFSQGETTLGYSMDTDPPLAINVFDDPAFPHAFDDPGLDLTAISALFGSNVTLALMVGCTPANCRVVERDPITCEETVGMDADDLAHVIAVIIGRAIQGPNVYGDLASELAYQFGLRFGAPGVSLIPTSKKRGQSDQSSTAGPTATPDPTNPKAPHGPCSRIAALSKGNCGATNTSGAYFLNVGTLNNTDGNNFPVWGQLGEGGLLDDCGYKSNCGAGRFLSFNVSSEQCSCFLCSDFLSNQYSCGISGQEPQLCDIGYYRDDSLEQSDPNYGKCIPYQDCSCSSTPTPTPTPVPTPTHTPTPTPGHHTSSHHHSSSSSSSLAPYEPPGDQTGDSVVESHHDDDDHHHCGCSSSSSDDLDWWWIVLIIFWMFVIGISMCCVGCIAKNISTTNARVGGNVQRTVTYSNASSSRGMFSRLLSE